MLAIVCPAREIKASLTIVAVFSSALNPASVRSSSGTLSMPRCSIFNFPAKRMSFARILSPYSKVSPGTAPSSAMKEPWRFSRLSGLPSLLRCGCFSKSYRSSKPMVAKLPRQDETGEGRVLRLHVEVYSGPNQIKLSQHSNTTMKS